jgi:COMPASS component SWD3
MYENSNQPREDDVVLGGQNLAPTGSVVLGGLEGVTRRLGVGNYGAIVPEVEQRIAALKDAIKYGQKGLELVIQSLQDESDWVQRVAYLLLREKTQPEVREVLRDFNFYRFMSCLRTIKGGENNAISPDGEAAAYLRGKTIRVVKLHEYEVLYTIPKSPRAKESYLVNSDGQTLIRVINASRHFIEVWHQGEQLHSLYGHEGEIGAIALSPDQQILASGSYDKTIKIWNLKTGKLICTFGNLLTWGAHRETVSCLAFTPDTQTLISGGFDSSIKSLISGSFDGTIKFWNLQTRDKPRTFKTSLGVKVIAISRDGQLLASTNWDGTIRLWDIDTGEVRHTLEGHSFSVSCFTFSPNGRILASAGSYDNTILLWDVGTGQLLHTLSGHVNPVSCLAFSWDGQTLVSGSQGQTIKVWGVE